MATRKIKAVPLFSVPGIYMTPAQYDKFGARVHGNVTKAERDARTRAINELTSQTPVIRDAALARMEASLA